MLVRTDDTDAFKNPTDDNFLKINFSIPEGQTCSKAILYCDSLKLEFIDPVSPIGIELSSEQTAILKDNVCGDIELYDGQNRKITIPCIFEFKTRERVKDDRS